MRLSKTRRTSELAFNMTPMIDVVFLLIIFFMTVSQITRVIDHPLPLPNVRWGGAEGISTTVTINLTQAGSIIISGAEVSLDRLLGQLSEQLKKFAGDPGRINIQIRCHRLAESRHVNRLIDRLTQQGFRQVRVAISEH